jgi:hypothetical protein
MVGHISDEQRAQLRDQLQTQSLPQPGGEKGSREVWSGTSSRHRACHSLGERRGAERYGQSQQLRYMRGDALLLESKVI